MIFLEMSAAAAGSKIGFSNIVSRREYNVNNETRVNNSIQALNNTKNKRSTRRRTTVRPVPTNMMPAYLRKRKEIRTLRNSKKNIQRGLHNIGAININTYRRRVSIINREMNESLNAYVRQLTESGSRPAATGGGSAAGAGL